MKSLRSQISFNTVTSIAIISALIITLSIYVYEKLYIEFVSTEVNAIGENISVDLIDYINEPAGSFNQTEVLLRLDEYEYAETAYIFNSQGELLNVYIGQAGLKARAKPDAFESNVDGSQIFKIDTSSKASNALEDVNSITALAKPESSSLSVSPIPSNENKHATVAITTSNDFFKDIVLTSKQPIRGLSYYNDRA